jgi:hypothetical protein
VPGGIAFSDRPALTGFLTYIISTTIGCGSRLLATGV